MDNNIKKSCIDTLEKKSSSDELIANIISEDDKIENHSKKSTENNNGKIVFEFNVKTIKYAVAGAIIIILFAWGINNQDKVSDVINKIIALLSPFVTGSCFAFIINVLMRPLEKAYDKIFKKCKEKTRNKFKRPVCLILSTLLIIGILFALLFIIIPEFIKALQNLGKSVPGYITQIEVWINKLVVFASNHGFTVPEMSFDNSKILDTVKNFISNSGLVDKTLNFTGSIVSGVVNIIVAIAFSLYLLAQKEKLGSQVKKLMLAFLPKKNDVERIVNFVEIVDRTFTNFIAGQLTEAVIIGVLCFIGMLIFKMPYAAVISVLVGFTALIPVFGAFIGTAVGAFLILLDEPMKAVWFVVFIVILQQLEGNLIYPKVVGKSVGLPGIWVLVAVTIGGTAGGILGILLSVPACAVIYCLLTNLVDTRIKKKEKAENQHESEFNK